MVIDHDNSRHVHSLLLKGSDKDFDIRRDDDVRRAIFELTGFVDFREREKIFGSFIHD